MATLSRRRLMMGSLVPLAQRTKLAPRPKPRPLRAPRQLDFVLDNVRLLGMTVKERQAALRLLARLLLEASGIARTEVSDDHA
jgi:hypothetical protein